MYRWCHIQHIDIDVSSFPVCNFTGWIEAYDGYYVSFVNGTHSPIKAANKNAP